MHLSLIPISHYIELKIFCNQNYNSNLLLTVFSIESHGRSKKEDDIVAIFFHFM